MGWIAFFMFVLGFVAFAWLALRKDWSESVIGWGSLATGVAAMSIVLALTSDPTPPPMPPTSPAAVEQQAPIAPPTAAQRRERVLAQFGGWDGAHRNLEAHVKASMNDPDSYDHVKTEFLDDGEFVRIKMKFRGTNAFGGKVLNEVLGVANIDGTLLAVEMVQP